MTPAVSVVIPVKDGERFIEDCLRSVVEQSDVAFDITVVDDGCTDTTMEIVATFPQVRVVAGPQRGPGPARNAGVAATEGAYIAFLDADDEMLPGRLAAQSRELDEDPNAGAVFGRQELRVEEGVDTPDWLRPDRQFHEPGGLHVMSGMFRRDAFERVDGFDESYFVTEDLDLLFRLREADVPMRFGDALVVRRRIHGDNLTVRSTEIREELLRSVGNRVADRRAARGSAT